MHRAVLCVRSVLYSAVAPLSLCNVVLSKLGSSPNNKLKLRTPQAAPGFKTLNVYEEIPSHTNFLFPACSQLRF